MGSKLRIIVFLIGIACFILIIMSSRPAKINQDNFRSKINHSLWVLCEPESTPCVMQPFTNKAGSYTPLFSDTLTINKVKYSFPGNNSYFEIKEGELADWIEPRIKYQLNPIAEDNGYLMGHKLLSLLKSTHKKKTTD